MRGQVAAVLEGFRMTRATFRFFLAPTLLGAITFVLPPPALADKQADAGATAAPAATTAVYTPDVVVRPDPASGMTVVAWQHVVALRRRGPAEATTPMILVSCAPKRRSAPAQDPSKTCAEEIRAWSADLSAADPLTVGEHKVELLVGPTHALAGLSGPWRRSVKPSSENPAGQNADKGKDMGAQGQFASQSALEIPAGWEAEMSAQGVLAAGPAASSDLRVRISRKPLSGSFEEAGSVTKDPGKESSGVEGGELILPVAFERARLLAPAAGHEGRLPLRLRFIASPLPDGFNGAVDTGAMSFPVPDGWELLYLEERLWLSKRQPEQAAAGDPVPTLWPWAPQPQATAPSTDAQQSKGELALGARSGSATTALVGCFSPSQPVQPCLPALKVVLDGLHLGSRSVLSEEPREDAPVQAAAIPTESFDPSLAAPSVTADGLESADLLASQQAEVQAQNQAILEGAAEVYFDAPPNTARMDEAVERFNDELLSSYPDGGEPPLWAQTRLGEIMQSLHDEEVMGP